MPTDLKEPINAFYIIGFSAWRLPAGTTVHDCFDYDLDEDDERTASLIRINADGRWAGTQQLKRYEPVLPGFWSEKVSACYVNQAYTTHGGYGVLTMLASVKPSSLDAILEHDRYELLKQVDQLFASFEPNAKFRRSGKRNDRPKFPRVFYMELPKRSAYASIEYLAVVRRLAEHLRQALNPRSVILPHLLLDTLLFPGPSPSRVSEEVLALSFVETDIEADTRSLLISDTVHDVVEYMIAIHLLKDLHIRLNELPFLSRSLGEYTNKIRVTDLNVPKRRVLRDRAKRAVSGNVSDSYEYEFLADRVHTSLECDVVSVTLSSILDILRLNSFANWERWPLSNYVGETFAEESRTSLRLPERLGWEFSNQLDGLKRKRELLNSREQALSDFLRDLASASSARANLRLQRSVWLLTRIATFFAFFGLGISLLTDERKRTIGNAILRLLRRLSG